MKLSVCTEVMEEDEHLNLWSHLQLGGEVIELDSCIISSFHFYLSHMDITYDLILKINKMQILNIKALHSC